MNVAGLNCGSRESRGEQGYALAAILWLLGLLALAVTSMSVFTVNSLSVVTTSRDRIIADALIRAGVEAGVYELLLGDPALPALGQTQFRLGNASVHTAWRGETGQIDLNLGPRELVAALLQRFGASEVEVQTFLDLMAQRLSPASGVVPGGVVNNGAAGPASFGHIGELAQIDMPNALIQRLTPHLTVYSGQPRIDPRLASREVLSLLPGMTEAGLRRLLELRERDQPANPSEWMSEAGEAGRYLTLERGSTARLRVEATLDNGFKSVAEVVVVAFADDTEPYRVLSWDSSPPDRTPDTIERGAR